MNIKTRKHVIMNVAVLDDTGQIARYDTLETLRDADAADVYDYTAVDTVRIHGDINDTDAEHLARVWDILDRGDCSMVHVSIDDTTYMDRDTFEWWTHYLKYVDRYCVVDQRIYRGEPVDTDIDYYETLASAAQAARDAWDRLSPYDRARAHVYVATDMEDMYNGGTELAASEGGFDSSIDG